MQPSSRARLRTLASLRVIGAVALLVTGGIHLDEYLVDNYSVLPTIGPLFLLNFAGGTILGLYFLVPSGAAPSWWRRTVDLVAAWSGIAVAAGALLALFVSEHTPLFGFMEQGYRAVIVIAIAAEAIAVCALGALVALRRTGPARTFAATNNYTAS
jgi:hypothetical protein